MDWDAIKQQVESNGDLKTVTMEVLREAYGAGKLGVNVRAEISDKLAGVGLAHVPKELPANQHERVRLYKRGTPIGKLIEDVLTPDESCDRRCVEYLRPQDARAVDILRRVREIVAE